MKEYTVYWRFKGKEFLMMPWNSTTIFAKTKKEATRLIKEELENVKIVRIDQVI